MDLRACEGCRVVLDVSGKSKDPEDWYREDGYDENHVAWDYSRRKNAVYVKCPVCGYKVFVI